MEAHLFRVILLRPLQLPLTVRICRCGLPLGSLDHHRAACARGGSEQATTNVLLRDFDLGFVGSEADGRRLEIVVDGLPIFSGAQLSTPRWCVCVRCGGMVGPPPRAVVEDGARVTRARRRKVATHFELVGRRARARLVVLGVEVGGRFFGGETVILDPGGSSQGQV